MYKLKTRNQKKHARPPLSSLELTRGFQEFSWYALPMPRWDCYLESADPASLGLSALKPVGLHYCKTPFPRQFWELLVQLSLGDLKIIK